MSNTKWGAAALAVFGIGLALFSFRPSPSAAQPGGGITSVSGIGSAGGPKYTVVETEGTNLLVVDNASNTMYYYTVDQGKEVGEPLHLRGSVDLNEVGKPSITPKHAKKDK